jgi:deazaflavin-dependent oxidoreductase (nitroreductase family)
MDKRRFTTALARYAFNPVVRGLFRAGIAPPGTVILETIGRRSGQPRRTPVTDGRDGDTFWIVAEHGHDANYVRNLEANPRVRVKIGQRWRTGSATVLPGDDPRARLDKVGHRVNGFMVRAVGTDLLTIRVDLDP